MKLLRLFNRQKSRLLSLALLRRMAMHLLEDLRARRKYELGVHLIGAFEMTELNETFLGHSGSTDVITFNHQESGGTMEICMARFLFRWMTPWLKRAALAPPGNRRSSVIWRMAFCTWKDTMTPSPARGGP